MRGGSILLLLLAGLSLTVPAGASAHARYATIALDYRLVLDAKVQAVEGMAVAILDGDRAVRVTARAGSTVTVLGDLGEPMLRIAPAGTSVNRASPTAAAAKLSTSGRGWKRLSDDASFTWHEHRLAPPPWDAGAGRARFVIRTLVDGRPAVISGTFVRHERPALWPWALVGAVLVSLAVGAVRLGWAVATPLGAALVAFSIAAAPNGRVAWTQLGLGLGLAAVMLALLIRSHGARRTAVAGVLGAAAAAVSLGSLGVFRHGVVVSALPATLSRLLVEVGLVGGVAAAVVSFRPEARA